MTRFPSISNSDKCPQCGHSCIPVMAALEGRPHLDGFCLSCYQGRRAEEAGLASAIRGRGA